MDSTATSPPRLGVFRTVRSRMLFWIIAVTMPIYAGALYMSYKATARHLEAGAERDVGEVVARLVGKMDAVVRPIEGGIRTVGYQLEEIDPPREEYPRRILGILRAWPEIYGSAIAIEVANAGANAQPFAPYYFRREDNLSFADLANENYTYHRLPWYRRAADSGKPVWSQPYFDAGGGNAWMVTYSVPFFRNLHDGRRVLAGVITADLDLNSMRRIAGSATLGPIGMGWLSSPSAGEAFIEPIGASMDRIKAFDSSMKEEAIRKVGEEMLARKVTFALLPREVSAKPAYLAVRHLETLGWRVMLVIPKSELMAEALSLLRRQLWLGAIGLLLLIVAISVVSAGISRPIRELAVAVGKIREDELDIRLPQASRRDETGILTEALRRLGGSLREHIRLRAQSLAEQARLEHELQIAASIQQSMLPKPGATADLPPAIQVAATLLPAKQVGGDLYDYFRINDGLVHDGGPRSGSVLLAIGDVSDKGVPAALFMARLSGLLRVLGAAGEPPDRLLAAINIRLSEGNDACMFVTAGCGLFDVDTGRIRYASAGHDSPLLRDAAGNVRTLAAENGPAIGIEAVADYRLWEGFVAPGDTLVLFTDGVTEAQTDDGALFGLERFSELLRTAPDGHPATLVKRVVEAVSAHASGFHVTDDLTVLAVRWNPPGVTVTTEGDGMRWRIQPEVSDAGVRQTQQWLRAILAAREVVADRIYDAELIAEELLTNIVRAAGEQGRAVGLALDCTLMPAEVVLTVRDDGPPFDPLARASPKLDADISDRPIGGLGIPLIKQLADDCRYARVDGWNVLEIRLGRRPDSN